MSRRERVVEFVVFWIALIVICVALMGAFSWLWELVT